MSLSEQDLERMAELSVKCRFDPLLWAELAFPWGEEGTELADDDIRVWQSEVLDTIAQHIKDPQLRHKPCRIAVSSGHGIGKTAAMGMIATWAMSCWENPRVVTTANTENQLRTKTSPEIAKWFRMAVSRQLFDIDTLKIAFKDRSIGERWRLDFSSWSEHNTEAFQGLHNKGSIILLLVDEGSAIPEKVYDVMDGAMTDEGTVVVQVVFGNPTQNVGRFREFFRRYRDLWYRWQIDSREVEGTNKEYLQQLVDTFGEDSDYVRVRVRGQFPSSSSRQFIPSDLVDKAFGRHLRREQYAFAHHVISCDPAWTGDDELVIAHRQGLFFEILDVIKDNSNDVLIAQKLAAYEDKFTEPGKPSPQVNVDAGYGTGIVSAGEAFGRSWNLVWFGGKATDPGIHNKRVEMWRDMRDWLAAGGAIPRDQTLYEDLTGPETLPDPAGIIRLESKEHMRKRDLPSPDRADALALTFAFPPPNLPHSTGYERKPVVLSGEFNPYGA